MDIFFLVFCLSQLLPHWQSAVPRITGRLGELWKKFTKSTGFYRVFGLWLISRCWFQTFSGWWFEIVFFYFHPYLGKWSHFTDIFQMGWFNHQLVFFIFTRNLGEHDPNLTSIVFAIGLGWKQQLGFCCWGLKKKHQGCARDVRESMQFTWIRTVSELILC